MQDDALPCVRAKEGEVKGKKKRERKLKSGGDGERRERGPVKRPDDALRRKKKLHA